jgi:tRNA/rRNA methyltransferase
MPAPPPDAASPPDRTRFVLIGTSHAGNVGAAARAIKVMGFGELVLVAPRFADVLQSPEAEAMASGATDVLRSALIVPTLADALSDVSYACATAMTPRDFGPPTHAPRVHLEGLANTSHRVAFVFGSERYGMSNDDVYRCHACLSIPTAPDYGSLNLAQAIQLIAYEWRQALGGFDVAARTAPIEHATLAAIDGVLEHWRGLLVQIGYFDPQVPRKLMPRLQQLLNRAELSNDEVQILRGIARAAQVAIAQARLSAPAKSGDE